MNEWMEHFISQCLAGVPWGRYRRRAEKELRDHMQSLHQSMTEAEVLQRMGDPAELSRRYVREWRRRTLGQRILQRILTTAEVLLVGTVMVVMSYLYVINTHNFGKQLPGDWAFVAIPAAVILLGSSLTGSWTLAQLSSWVIAVIQLPPMLCWMLFGTFEMSGRMVSSWQGFGIHLLFFVWGIFNYYITVHFERVEIILSKAKSA